MKNFLKSNILKVIERVAEINSCNISTAILHQKTFPQFKNMCHGRPLVVCGAGPSLQKYKPINGATHIAVNKAFLYDKVDFDFIFAQDWEGIKKVKNELRNYRPDSCVKLLGSQEILLRPEKEISESYAISCNALRFNVDMYIRRNGFESKFVQDIDRRALGGMPNVGISVMQFALYMNPAELYIVGCDMSGTHFTSKNQTEKEKAEEKEDLIPYWDEMHTQLVNKWKEFKKFAEIYYSDTRIISVNPVGLKGVFEDWYQDEEKVDK